MIKIVLVDDEQPALDELTYLLENSKNIQILESFRDSTKALEYIMFHEVDAVFLDISMPLLDGFSLAEAMTRLKNPPHIIFSTAYEEYAIKAFEVNAIDYLLKPITEERLQTTLGRLEDYFKKDKDAQDEDSITSKEKIEELVKNRNQHNPLSRLAVWKNDRIHLIQSQDIIYIEAIDKRISLYTQKGVFHSNETLNHFESILPGNLFFRSHRSYIIQLDAITEIIPWFNNTYAVTLTGFNENIPISRRNVKKFKELLRIQ